VRRAIQRHPGARATVDRLLDEAMEILASFSLFKVTRELLIAAGALPEPDLRSLDAVHLATALAASRTLDAFVSYDLCQLRAGESLGLRVSSPGV
jgi:hypothetical protein